MIDGDFGKLKELQIRSHAWASIGRFWGSGRVVHILCQFHCDTVTKYPAEIVYEKTALFPLMICEGLSLSIMAGRAWQNSRWWQHVVEASHITDEQEGE